MNYFIRSKYEASVFHVLKMDQWEKTNNNFSFFEEVKKTFKGQVLEEASVKKTIFLHWELDLAVQKNNWKTRSWTFLF